MARIHSLDKIESINWNSIKNPDVFVIDMTDGFCKEGPMSDYAMMDIVPNIGRLLKTIKLKYAVTPWFLIDYPEARSAKFKVHPEECLAKTKGIEVIKELSGFVDLEHRVFKNSTNGFHELNDYLTKLKQNASSTKEIIVVGCSTDICVMQFVLTMHSWLIANQLDVEVIIPLDCVDTYESGNSFHPAEQFNQMAVTLMQQAGIKIYKNICD